MAPDAALLSAVAHHLDALNGLDVSQRDAVLAELRGFRETVDEAPTSPETVWLGLEHQLGAQVVVAIGLNRTSASLLQAWDSWLETTRRRVAQRAATATDEQVAVWTAEARGHLADPLSLLRTR